MVSQDRRQIFFIMPGFLNVINQFDSLIFRQHFNSTCSDCQFRRHNHRMVRLFLYGTASALIFNRLFFPNYDPMMGTLASFGTYAVGFAARPIGGIVCGHFGDRIGRKSMLILTLLIMGIATSLIGLLPTYNQIGVWAPVLLIVLRLAQGFAVGGEWGGAVLMAVEHAPKGKRGFYGSWPQIGVPAGLLLSTLIFGQISKLPEEAMLSWGWRVAFLLSILLVGVGLFIRLSVVEPPVFTEIKQTRTAAQCHCLIPYDIILKI